MVHSPKGTSLDLARRKIAGLRGREKREEVILSPSCVVHRASTPRLDGAAMAYVEVNSK